MRILLLVGSFRCIGGVQEMVDNLAREFIRYGHSAAIITDRYAVDAVERVSDADVQLTDLDIPKEKPASWRHPERLFRRSRGAALAEQELGDRIVEWRPDVVSSHEWLWDRFPAIGRACEYAKVPFVQTLYDASGSGKLGNRALESLRRAHSLAVVSRATKSHFESLLDGCAEMRVIYPGVDVAAAYAAAPSQREREYIFCAGRLLLAHKAIDTLIEAFRLVARDYPLVDLLIAGGGSNRDSLEAVIARHRLKDRVRLLGVVSRQELWSLYKGALFFAMPSRMREGLGMVFLEAMACGKAVIASAQGGVPEIVSADGTGCLLEGGDPNPRTIAQAMRQLLDDPHKRARMGRNGYELANARYTWAHAAAAYLALFEHARKAPALPVLEAESCVPAEPSALASVLATR
jgi:glycosyltransferase involved in cell wall biosynthesis